jgi:dolichyldiphosphatase
MAPPEAAAAARGGSSAVLRAVNKHDKWLVSGTVFALVVRNFGVPAVWTLLGSLVNAVVCKIAKILINQPRPGSARKTDPGMPSSHACSITYLSVYAALLILQPDTDSQKAVGLGVAAFALAAAVVVLAVGAFLTSLRVICGDHTVAQVAAGAALGLVDGATWCVAGPAFIDLCARAGVLGQFFVDRRLAQEKRDALCVCHRASVLLLLLRLTEAGAVCRRTC